MKNLSTATVLVLFALSSVACNGLKATPTPLAPTFVGGSLTASANPPTVFLGGSSTTITARVQDAIGGPFRGQTVRFSSSSGTVSPASATTDADGRASTTLTASSAARVTATVDTLAPATVDVGVDAPFSVDVQIGQPQQMNASLLTWQAIVSVTATRGVIAPPRPATVDVDCGTGGPVQRYEGFFGTTAFTCTATSEGTFMTRVIARTSSGFTVQAETPVTMATNLPPLSASLNVDSIGPVEPVGSGSGRRVKFTAFLFPTGRLATGYEFDFGDGTKTPVIASQSTEHVYTKAGTFTATVSMKTTDGRSAKAAKIVDITF